MKIAFKFVKRVGKSLLDLLFFSYRLADSEDWTVKLLNGSVNRYTVENTPTYRKYEFKIRSYNDIGDAPEPEIVYGFSGEGSE